MNSKVLSEINELCDVVENGFRATIEHGKLSVCSETEKLCKMVDHFMCTSWLSLKFIFHRFEDMLQRYVNESSQNFQRIKDEEKALSFFSTNWYNYRDACYTIVNIWTYRRLVWPGLDKGKYYFKDIFAPVMSTWLKGMFKPNNERILNIACKFIREDREGKKINRKLLRDLVDTSFELVPWPCKSDESPIYKRYFEDKFIAASCEYYEQKSIEFLATHSIYDYMDYVKKCREEENKRADRFNLECGPEAYFIEDTHRKIYRKCEAILVTAHLNKFFVEIENAFSVHDMQAVQRITDFIDRSFVDPTQLQLITRDHIIERGLQAIGKCTSNDPRVFVETIAQLHKKYTEIFGNLYPFYEALKEACTTLVNEHPLTTAHCASKAPEFFAKCCHMFLMESSNLTEDDLNKFALVLKFIEDKQLFINCYTKLLASRLLSHASRPSTQAERKVLNALTQACGYAATIALEHMIDDIELSKCLSRDFFDSNPTLSGFELSIQVLRMRSWPFNTKFNETLALPMELEPHVQAFNKFYQSFHDKRSLHWLYHLSKGEITTQCLKKKYTLHMNTYQMATLLQFNNQPHFSVQELIDATQMEEIHLMQTVQSLLKAKILTSREDSESSLHSHSVIMLNMKYKNKNNVVKVQQPKKIYLNDKKDSGLLEHNEEDLDRQFIIQAAIMRIMKERRQMQHADLMQAVCAQLSSEFSPNVSTLKICIESLLDLDYLKREEGQQGIYSYSCVP